MAVNVLLVVDDCCKCDSESVFIELEHIRQVGLLCHRVAEKVTGRLGLAGLGGDRPVLACF